MTSFLRAGLDRIRGLLTGGDSSPGQPDGRRPTGAEALADQLARAQLTLELGGAQDVVDELEGSLEALSVTSAATWAVLGEAYDRLDQGKRRDRAVRNAVDTFDLAKHEPAPAEATALARALVAVDRLDDAVVLLRSAVERAPQDASVARLLAEQLEQSHDRADAAAAYGAYARLVEPDRRMDVLRHAVDLDPDNIDLRAEVGQAKLLAGDASGAVQALLPSVDRLPLSHPGHSWLAEALREAGDVDAALERAELVLEEHPDNAKALHVRADCRRDRGEITPALNDFGRVLELDPDDDAARRSIVLLLMGAARVDEAVDEAGRFVAARPHDPGTLALLGHALTAAGDRMKAVRAFDRALEVAPDDFTTRLGRADALRLLEQFDEARRELNELVKERPDDVVALGTRGRVRVAQGELHEAIEDFDRALEFSGRLDWVLLAKADTQLELGSAKDARETLDRLLEVDPGHEGGRLGMGRALVSLGEPEGAEQIARELTADNPELGAAHFMRGVALLVLQRWRDALEAFDEAQLHQGLGDPATRHKVRGEAHYRLAEWSAARDEFAAVVELEPSDSYSRLALGRSRYSLGDLETAAKDLERAAGLADDGEKSETVAEALFLLGEVQRLRGEFDAALLTLHRALGIEPKSAFGLGTKGQVLASLERRPEAVSALRAAVGIDGDLPWAHAALGDLLRLEGNYEEAHLHLVQTADLGERSAFVRGTRGQVLAGLGRHEEAVAELRAAWDLDHAPWIAAAYARALPATASAEEVDYAVGILDHAIAAMPDEPALLVTKADVLRLALRSADALATIDQYLAAEQDDEALAVKAHILVDLSLTNEAEELATELLARHADFGFARIARARARTVAERFREALADTELCVEAAPQHSLAQLMKASILFALGRFEACLATANALLGREPENSAAHAVAGWASRRLDPPADQQAVAHLRAAVEVQPDELGSQVELAESLEAIGKSKEADSIREAVVQRLTSGGGVHDADSLAQAGWAALCLGRPAEAVTLIRECLGLNPSMITARFGLGLALLHLGRGELAVDEYEGAASLLDRHSTPEYGVMLVDEALRDLRSSQDAGLPESLSDDAAQAEGALVQVLESLRTKVGADVPQAQHR